MQKILTVGGAMYDAFIEYDTFGACPKFMQEENMSYVMLPAGKKLEVKDIAYHAGGGAVNSAVSFAKLGFTVETFFKCGIDKEAEFIANAVHAHNIKTDHIVRSEQNATGCSFILPHPQGNRPILAYRGANKTLKESEIPQEAIENADLLYVTSLSGQAAQVLFPLVILAKKHNKKVAVNPGTSQLCVNVDSLKNALPYIDILILNMYEAQLLMKTIHSDFSLEKFFPYILSQGPSVVVVTDGCNGVYVNSDSSIFFQQTIKTQAVSTVGAGDAFSSAFVSYLLYGYPLKKALQAGIINSCSIIQHVGAQTGLLSKEQIDEMLD